MKSEGGRYWNRRIRNLKPYVPGEQPRGERIIKLNTNENPYPPSPGVSEAVETLLHAQAAGGAALRLYPDPACTELREAIAARYGVRPEEVFCGNGSDEVLAFSFAAFFESNDGPPLLFPDITYSFYPVYADLWNIQYKTIPLNENFEIRMEDYLVPSGGVVFPNPNAPTGIAVPKTEILRLAEYLKERGRVLIVDEAYTAFGRASGTPNGAESLVPFIADLPNLLTVHTFSKSASLAGLRLGFAIGNGELVEALCRIRDSFNSYTVDRLAQAAGKAAVLDASYYEAVNRRLVGTRGRVSAALNSLGFETLPSSANFIFARHPRFTGNEIFTGLREKGILVRHWDRDRIRDFLRISIGTDDEMDVFISACREIVK
ncbi:MAG: aminotransferase class I/II-fold pyridoxal phosphate-dependent enzyme [Treponema sp.]|nr:aminotransferase class I/II-fold pyridoxal phosphate-dependent enzyme [Treponema sp.]